MFEKLEKIKERFEEVYRLLQLPETVSDQELYRDLNKEYKNLTPVVEEFDRYLASKKEAEEAEEILSDPDSDEDFREMAREQKEEALAAMQAGEEELKILLLPVVQRRFPGSMVSVHALSELTVSFKNRNKVSFTITVHRPNP